MLNTKMLIELFGYLGSILVVISMLMTSVYRLRIINMIGSIIFAIYALIIRSYPTAFMNFFLVGINVYHLMRLRHSESSFRLVEIGTDDRYLDYLLSLYADDIKIFFQKFADHRPQADSAYLICNDSQPVGIVMGRRNGTDDLDLVLDYSTPAYRDCSVGKFLYPELKKTGIRRVTFSGAQENHVAYMETVGFEKKDGVYVREL